MTTSNHAPSAPPLDQRTRRVAAELAASLLSDAMSDVELVSRELSLSPVMLDRTRRALDCLQCVAEILETEVNVRFAGRGDGDPHEFKRLREYLDEWSDEGLEMLVADFLESGRDASQGGGSVAPA
ncbi:hypothetical protein [Caballeronia hypogeia]|uniref:hypothetical protein n=1 Tax=Caballeronia hypogeia TaxID=1777140 RepID=UPI0007721724|nr:hypothetical protein [Caballeronia hypogeia]